jgi:hypothetical protein
MPRPKPRSVTHLGVEGSPLDIDQREALVTHMKEIGLPEIGIEGFARGVNSAIVAAYVLEPNMASRKERIAFLKGIVRRPDTMRGVPVSDANCYNRHHNRIAVSEDVEAIKKAPSLMRTVKRLTRTLTRSGREPRDRPADQPLANNLAELWRRHFKGTDDEKPTCDCWNGVTGSHFVRTLQWVLPEASMYYTGERREKSIYALGKIAERAIKHLDERDKTFLKYNPDGKRKK